MITSTVYDLRREGKKVEAYNHAVRLFQEDPNDDDIKKALSWTLIDLCKSNLSVNNLNQAGTFLNQLENLEFDYEDDFVVTIKKQITFLKPKVDKLYSRIKQIDDYSKNGRHLDALKGIQGLEKQNQLATVHHETYGWIIYRYIKAEEQNLTSVQVRGLLSKYMKLSNPRPSLLHSLILIFSVGYSKEHEDFNLYKFFILWGPENLRKEDKEEQANENDLTKTYPSLLSRLFKELISRRYPIDIEFLIENIKLDSIYVKELDSEIQMETRIYLSFHRSKNYESIKQVLDLIREPIFWELYILQKNKKFNDLWRLFDSYINDYNYTEGSLWHSKILSLAERYMSEKEEWRFLKFFEKWNPENFMISDWNEVKKEDKVYNGLAVKALKKTFNILKSTDSYSNFSWLLQAYIKAIEYYPDNEWLLREKALLHIKNGEKSEAENLFQDLVPKLGTNYYIWQEFAECFEDDVPIQIGMLLKALSLEKNEDFLGDIRLKLSKLLIKVGQESLAAQELKKYKDHRVKKSWNLSEEYSKLFNQVPEVDLDQNIDSSFYKEYISRAEKIAYKNLDWIEVVLVDRWKSREGKKTMKFSDDKELILIFPENKIPYLKKIEVGEIARFKIYTKQTEDGIFYIPLLGESLTKKPWSILEETYVYINFINRKTNKHMVHGITYENQEVFFPQDDRDFKVGDFLHSRFYTDFRDDSKVIELVDFKKVDRKEPLSLFPKGLCIVDHVNDEKNLFHVVLNKNLQGIVKYHKTDLRPKEGDFLKIKYVARRNRENKWQLEIIELEPSKETKENLMKEVEGTLEVKFKIDGCTYGCNELQYLDADETYNVKPSFGFLDDYYVPVYLLNKFHINSDQHVKAKVLLSGEKWKVFDLAI